MNQVLKKLLLIVPLITISVCYASEAGKKPRSMSRICFGNFEGKAGFGVEHQGRFIGYAPATSGSDSAAMLQAVSMLQKVRVDSKKDATDK